MNQKTVDDSSPHSCPRAPNPPLASGVHVDQFSHQHQYHGTRESVAAASGGHVERYGVHQPQTRQQQGGASADAASTQHMLDECGAHKVGKAEEGLAEERVPHHRHQQPRKQGCVSVCFPLVRRSALIKVPRGVAEDVVVDVGVRHRQSLVLVQSPCDECGVYADGRPVDEHSVDGLLLVKRHAAHRAGQAVTQTVTATAAHAHLIETTNDGLHEVHGPART
mmetsp:Transcript_7017/g.20335  ORF Transcript_7017/g.20335 Transcript_7017/m.20335 type:complete len:222 (-) Transcript_7017:47-712(-)